MDVPHTEPEKNAFLFRWSKQVDNDRLDWWETELTANEIPFVVEKSVKRQRWKISVYETKRSAAADLLARYGGAVKKIPPESWAPQSEAQTPAPLLIRNRLVITESDEAEEIARLESEYPDREILSFPPRLAFGTGSHPTTASCLRLLTDASAGLNDGGWSLLDLGAGSGILAIAAERLGAQSVLAVESDPLAMAVAEENAGRHGTERLTLVQADLTRWLRSESPDRDEILFDVATANLFSDLLTRTVPLLARRMKPGGRLIVSGFLTSQARQVTEAARAAGFDLTRFLRRGKWVAAAGEYSPPGAFAAGIRGTSRPITVA